MVCLKKLKKENKKKEHIFVAGPRIPTRDLFNIAPRLLNPKYGVFRFICNFCLA